jgi:hypothetical protein
MEFLNLIKEFLTILLPAGIVLYGMFLVVKSFIAKDLNKSLLEIKAHNAQIALPLRLQAYERMALFLERTSIPNLIRRLNDSTMSSREFHQVLLFEIREEFNHNLSQQVYMSHQAWQYIKSAVEETVSNINEAARNVDEKAPARDLARAIFAIEAKRETNLNEVALQFLKEEIQQVF